MTSSDDTRATLVRMVGRMANGFSQTDRVFVTVSRLDPQKGVDLAIRALTHLDERHKLLVVGQGAELQKLQTLATTLGLAESRVRFLGAQERVGVKEALLTADAFVFPVRNPEREGLPMAVLEAVAAGLPAVVPTRSGWPAELLKSLFFTDVEDASTLASAMSEAAKAERVTLPPSLTLAGMAEAYRRALFLE